MDFLIAAVLMFGQPPKTSWVFVDAKECKCGETCPCVRRSAESQPLRLRCTDGTLVERTATGWRIVGSAPITSLPNYSETPNSSGCRVINGQMVCPQLR